jgi:hypothetical protein
MHGGGGEGGKKMAKAGERMYGGGGESCKIQLDLFEKKRSAKLKYRVEHKTNPQRN